MKVFEKIFKVIPTDLPEKTGLFQRVFHLTFFQLTLGNSVTPSDSSVSGISVKYTLLIRVLLRHIHTHRQVTLRPNACILLFAFFKIHKVECMLNWLFSSFTHLPNLTA